MGCAKDDGQGALSVCRACGVRATAPLCRERPLSAQGPEVEFLTFCDEAFEVTDDCCAPGSVEAHLHEAISAGAITPLWSRPRYY
mmetsp:Transcript_60167/g.196550  ORF Transcript_60167/g.196550 Transcript_60167/m.196550 type:complete len:85 (+) Transcript_60167:70-324(+)